jgi:hypothetical protein
MSTSQTFPESPGFLREDIKLGVGGHNLASDYAKQGVMQDFVNQRGL